MNRNTKKLITATIICTAFSTTCVPTTLSIGNSTAYAYSDNEITSLNLTSGVSILPIYSSVSHNKDYRIKKGEKMPVVIYSKLSSEQTNIKLDSLEAKAADIRVFLGNENLKLADIHNQINLSEGEKKSIYIRLYDSKNSADSAYTTEYELIVEREINDEDVIISDSESEDDTIALKEYDDIYLNRLVLFDCNNNKINFAFDKTQPIYNINVDENISYINVKAVPEQQSYKLFIDDKELDPSDDKNTRLIQLDNGKNIIKLKIISSDNKRREYFLVVTRGISILTDSNSNTTNNSENKSSQNIQTGGSWQYKKADGTIATGWTCIRSEWYYFDSTGSMKTGWMQDSSGKWYYLRESGVMARNDTIDGYKIDSNGVCINKI